MTDKWARRGYNWDVDWEACNPADEDFYERIRFPILRMPQEVWDGVEKAECDPKKARDIAFQICTSFNKISSLHALYEHYRAMGHEARADLDRAAQEQLRAAMTGTATRPGTSPEFKNATERLNQLGEVTDGLGEKIVQELMPLIRLCKKLAQYCGVEDSAGIAERFTDRFPGLRDVRNSIAHWDDRLLGIGAKGAEMPPGPLLWFHNDFVFTLTIADRNVAAIDFSYENILFIRGVAEKALTQCGFTVWFEY